MALRYEDVGLYARGPRRSWLVVNGVGEALLAESERRLADAVQAARAQGHSWGAIGAMVDTSGEAARQRCSEDRREGHP